MSSGKSHDTVVNHPAAVALRKLLEQIENSEPGQPLDSQIVAAEAHIDTKIIEDQMFVLASMGFGRVEFQILDEDSVPIKNRTYPKESQLPKSVEDQYGNRIKVTPYNTSFCFIPFPWDKERYENLMSPSGNRYSRNNEIAKNFNETNNGQFDVKALWKKVATVFLFLLVADASALLALGSVGVVTDIPLNEGLLKIMLGAVIGGIVSLTGYIFGQSKASK